MYVDAHSVQMVEVLSVTVHCTVASRFAHTVMTSSALNKANSSQEIFFEVDLPKTAFITNFSIASGRKMEKFSVSVNIAAESNVTFILTYEELLQRKFGKYEILTRINPKQLEVNYMADYILWSFEVEAHTSLFQAHISFSPTLDQQRKCPECDGSLINGDFIIKYDVKRASSLGDIQIVNGYFVHFFAPPDLPRIPKNVVFVIDRSGSMRGTKMKQTRVAMESILSDVHPEDYFGIILFDRSIDLWKESLTKATEENVDEAIQFVRQINPTGATNINDSVMKAIHMLQDDRRKKKLPERSVDMIILLTDGMPNKGERNLQRIQQNVCEAIGGNMTLFCLGFGDDVDYSFLDVMAKQNNGMARRIYEASDATLQLQGFYDEVASPLLSAVDLRYPDNAVDSLTPHHFSQLFNGSEIVVAGRLSENDMDNFLVEVFANGVGEGQVIHPYMYIFLCVLLLLPPCHYTFCSVDGDPHFMIELPEREDALCFNINDSPGTIFNLVKDPSIGLLVNGQTIGDKMVAPDGKVNTYFGRLGVVHHSLGVRLEVTTEYITLSQDGQKVKLLWSDQASLKGPSVDLLLTKDRSVKVTLRDSVKFVILLHKVWKMHPYHQDYLGFYTLDSHLLSPSVHGLLGQFYHGIEFEVGDLRPGEVPEKPDATMYVKGHQLNVTRGWQRDFSKDLKKGENVPCWFIHSNGTGLIDGSAEDYIVSGLFNTV
uniref:Inter-alpha-trypsin inhibitor heavy chain H3 n=1 Tax=Gadus morhua TaxID=8049 RepID=A0A8C5BPN4_GADMO